MSTPANVASAGISMGACCDPILLFLQPSFCSRNPRGFDTVASAHLTYGFGEIISHGAFGEAEFSSDVSALHAFARKTQNLAFAIGKRIHFGPGLGGQIGMDDAQSLLHAPDSFGKFLGAHIFE